MKTYLRIISYAKKYWKHLVVSIICTILFASFNGLSVYLTIPLLDTLFQESGGMVKTEETSTVQDDYSSFLPDPIEDVKNEITELFNDFVFTGNTMESLFRICIVILVAFLLKNIFGYMQAYFLIFVEQGIVKDMRNEAYSRLHELPMSYFKRERVGNLISRIMNDVAFIQTSISATFMNAIREPLSIVVFLGIAVSISWKLTIFAFIILPFSMAIISWIGNKLRKQSSIIQQKVADITSIIQETISGVKIVKAFVREDYENKKFTKETDNFFRLMLKITRTRNLAAPITETLSVIVGVGIVFYGGSLVLEDGSLKASEFLGFLFAIFQLMPPIKELSTVNNRIQESAAAGDRIFEVIDTEPDIKNIPNCKPINRFEESIRFENVSFMYEDGEEKVLNDVSFEVPKKSILALVGPSGGGKSTLVDLIPRFFDPTGGSILIDGIDIKNYCIGDLRSLIGIVTQETILFNESIRNNIAYGSHEIPLERIEEAAKVANAHDFIMELPEGYNTNIGERGVKLSGGQRQRIAIARALLKNPEIMIFDEATSALDNESELLVQEAIERLMQNRTVLVIAHRLSTIRNASNILVLDRGSIVQQGTHEQLIDDNTGLYYKFYQMQFRD